MKNLELKQHGRLLMALLAVVISFFGCTGLVSPGMEGTYVNDAGSEFSLASDTLVVEKAAENHYLIHRSTGFQLLDESGKPGKLQHEREEWTALYDEKTEMLTEQRSGKLISFTADYSEVTVGKRRYKRID